MTYKVGTSGTAVVGASIIPGRRRLAIICDDIGLPNGTGLWVGKNPMTASGVYSQNCWWLWALGIMTWPYELVAISSGAGRTTATAATNFGTEVGAFNPQEVWIMLGRNDMASASAATTALASLDLIIANCLALDPTMIVRIGTVIPGDGTSNTSSFQQANATYNYGIMRRQQTNDNVQCIDSASVLRDPTSTTGAALSGMISSSDHLNVLPQGHVNMGIYWANAINYLPSIDLRPNGNGDVYGAAANTASLRFTNNPFFAGTSGSTLGGSTGTTGTVPTSWAVLGNNGVTSTFSVTQDSLPVQSYVTSGVSASTSIPVPNVNGITAGMIISGPGVTGTPTVASAAGTTVTASSAQTISSGTVLTLTPPYVSPWPRTWWNCQLGGTSTAAYTIIMQSGSTTASPTPITPGTSQMRGRVHVRTSGVTGVQAIFFQIQVYTTGFASTTYNVSCAYTSGSGISTFPPQFTIEIPTFVIPTSSVFYQMDVTIAGASGVSPTGTVSIASPFLELVV